MVKVLVNDTSLTKIANAIREKNGSSDTYKPAEMADAIAAIETGSGDLPEEAFNITGSCKYKFAYDSWNWYIDTYGNRIKTSGITDCQNMFLNSYALELIPFDINCSNTGTVSGFNSMFYECNKLREIPRIRGALVSMGTGVLGDFMRNCKRVRYMPDDYFDEIDFSKITNCNSKYYYIGSSIFYGCASLRKIPTKFIRYDNPQANTSVYPNLFNSCYAADEITNIPCPYATDYEKTSNIFNATFSAVSRAKNITLDAENGTKKQSWKSQTIDLSYFVGYCQFKSSATTDYNSGITADKEVKDDATYQALKNDDDWFSTKLEYSRYNHDSAVNTINSLPDTSEYLSTAGGTNTIKFLGASGSLTDGGAINTLTEEEIAVAAAKGWTITYYV